ncbi:hypothetical protein X798_01072 [Onchocerca flexuosa]|nr:hypothetical protein X798_01072 [Onchocerca flexuosa]
MSTYMHLPLLRLALFGCSFLRVSSQQLMASQLIVEASRNCVPSCSIAVHVLWSSVVIMDSVLSNSILLALALHRAIFRYNRHFTPTPSISEH